MKLRIGDTAFNLHSVGKYYYVSSNTSNLILRDYYNMRACFNGEPVSIRGFVDGYDTPVAIKVSLKNNERIKKLFGVDIFNKEYSTRKLRNGEIVYYVNRAVEMCEVSVIDDDTVHLYSYFSGELVTELDAYGRSNPDAVPCVAPMCEQNRKLIYKLFKI